MIGRLWSSSIDLPRRAASLSFRRAVVTLARSASVMRRSGLAKLSKTPPPAEACRIRTVPSKCRSRIWFMSTAYKIVPADGERIFQMVPPREWPELNGMIVKPWHLPVCVHDVAAGKNTSYIDGRTLQMAWLRIPEDVHRVESVNDLLHSGNILPSLRSQRRNWRGGIIRSWGAGDIFVMFKCAINCRPITDVLLIAEGFNVFSSGNSSHSLDREGGIRRSNETPVCMSIGI